MGLLVSPGGLPLASALDKGRSHASRMGCTVRPHHERTTVIKLILVRLLWATGTLGIASFLVFFLAHAVPGDPVAAYAGPQADSETRARLRREMRLDDPFVLQYARYMRRVAVGDWGHSFVTGENVVDAIRSRFPATAIIGLFGLAFGLFVGTTVGVFTARYATAHLDAVVFLLTTLIISVPAFLLARLLQYNLAYRLGILPVAGFTSLWHLVLPIVCVALPTAGYYARLVHGTMTEVLSHDYVRAARAHGLPEYVVLFYHALPNAFIPVLAVLGADIAAVLGGVVFVESVFAVPGLGSLGLNAALHLDVPMIMGTVLFATALVVLCNLCVDLLHPLLDPRVRPK